MKRYYTIKNATGIQEHQIVYLEPIVCNAKQLFAKYLYKLDSISTIYLENVGKEILAVKNTEVRYNHFSDITEMPIIIDEKFVDVVTGTKFDENIYKEFIDINKELSIDYVSRILQSLNNFDDGIEKYAAAIQDLLKLLNEYSQLSLKTNEYLHESKKEDPWYDRYQRDIESFQTYARTRLNAKKN